MSGTIKIKLAKNLVSSQAQSKFWFNWATSFTYSYVKIS